LSFDSTTNTITIRKDGDFLADSGSFFLKVFRDLALQPNVPHGVRRDWKTIEAWLRCEVRELTQQDYESFGVTFRSYLARGVAPSRELEAPFKYCAQAAKAEGWPIAPVPRELIPVFNRMLASAKQIQQKRVDEALQFADAMKAMNGIQSRPARHVGTSTQTSSAVHLNWIPLVTAITMLVMAFGGEWPYGFYQLLRFIVFGTAIYVVIQTLRDRQYWPWIMSGIAILFNPVLPISFTQDDWQAIDFGVALVFVVALIHLRLRR
jgi:hypothetical protein